MKQARSAALFLERAMPADTQTLSPLKNRQAAIAPFRIDIPLSAAQDYAVQARILRAIRDSTRASGMQEPLPQYLVDLFAKQISVGASAVGGGVR